MNVKIITVEFDAKNKNFNDEFLLLFLHSNDAYYVEHHFFCYQEKPYITFIVRYDEKNAEQNICEDDLSEVEQKLFDQLRYWRNKRSQKEGYPPYVLFTNKQLKQIAQSQPSSLKVLQQVEGVGKSRIEKYGKDVLAIVKENCNEKES